MQQVGANCPPCRSVAVLAHRIAASYRAEGRDSDAYNLASSISDPSRCRN